MYVSQVAERLALLKREIDDLKQMNLRYRRQSKHSPLCSAAHESRRLRLTAIRNELAFMVRRAA
jgi:hypothetical protein